MIVGHLPAGYLAACGLEKAGASRLAFAGLLLGSILPDIDLFWFFLIDSSYHHHTLIMHRPILWMTVLIAGLAVRRPFLSGLGAGGLLHMILDSFAGAIAWLWPLTEASHPMIIVQPTHSHWLLSFMAHWFFLVELMILVLAVALFLYRRGRTI